MAGAQQRSDDLHHHVELGQVHAVAHLRVLPLVVVVGRAGAEVEVAQVLDELPRRHPVALRVANFAYSSNTWKES